MFVFRANGLGDKVLVLQRPIFLIPTVTQWHIIVTWEVTN